MQISPPSHNSSDSPRSRPSLSLLISLHLFCCLSLTEVEDQLLDVGVCHHTLDHLVHGRLCLSIFL
ncbi:unnamed protein product [Prunus armeniaca]|uniref:Uncharacterized protein n=1 Tax=Prunus armeniaca TaxID=36596 RepID=A0A6J5X395_PRUAR|nr:unnamed protein product [Prunus armeniaca]